MLAFTRAIVVCSYDSLAALAMKRLSLQFLAYFLVQGFKFILWCLSAT
jgi:hypothetical protein